MSLFAKPATTLTPSKASCLTDTFARALPTTLIEKP